MSDEWMTEPEEILAALQEAARRPPPPHAPAQDDLLAPLDTCAELDRVPASDNDTYLNMSISLRLQAEAERNAVCEVLRVHGPFRSGRWLLDACTAAIQRVREER